MLPHLGWLGSHGFLCLRHVSFLYLRPVYEAPNSASISARERPSVFTPLRAQLTFFFFFLNISASRDTTNRLWNSLPTLLVIDFYLLNRFVVAALHDRWDFSHYHNFGFSRFTKQNRLWYLSSCYVYMYAFDFNLDLCLALVTSLQIFNGCSCQMSRVKITPSARYISKSQPFGQVLFRFW